MKQTIQVSMAVLAALTAVQTPALADNPVSNMVKGVVDATGKVVKGTAKGAEAIVKDTVKGTEFVVKEAAKGG